MRTKTMLKHVDDYVNRVESLLPDYYCDFYVERKLSYEISEGLKIEGIS